MYKNTILCCDLKTILSSDRIMRAGKDYTGILRREVDIDDFRYDEHFTFTETLLWTMKPQSTATPSLCATNSVRHSKAL